MKYADLLNVKVTPQNEAVLGKAQVQNSAGGYVFAVSDWTRLDRFLILGSEGNTYYSTAQKLTKENATATLNCIKADGVAVVNKVVDISLTGRAPKNDPAIFVLALASAFGDVDTKHAVRAALSKVCRTGTHLFQFTSACKSLRGWGSGLKRAVSEWYTTKSVDDLAYQLVKYQQRGGWTHRDVLRLTHPKTNSRQLQSVLRWASHGVDKTGPMEVVRGTKPNCVARSYMGVPEFPSFIEGFERLKKATTTEEVVGLLAKYRLPRECVPTQFLTECAVWDELLHTMPLTAMVRNLGNMTKIGLLTPLSAATSYIANVLGDEEKLKRARLHPLAALVALKTYGSGKGVKGSSTWQPVQQLVTALDTAFYKSFSSVVPTGKRWLIAIDCSASMTWSDVAGMTGINPRIAAAALSLVTANIEPSHHIIGFTDAGYAYPGSVGSGRGVSELKIHTKQRLDDVISTIEAVRAGGTDCALPMMYAKDRKLDVDMFVTITDNETWAGNIQPFQALQQYRQSSGINAKSAIIGMTATGFSLADPADAGMLDFVGFDTAVPQLLADFAGYTQTPNFNGDCGNED